MRTEKIRFLLIRTRGRLPEQKSAVHNDRVGSYYKLKVGIVRRTRKTNRNTPV